MPSVVALVLLLVSGVTDAQSAAQGRLIGRVVDDAGQSLPGVFVTVRPIQQTSNLPELEAISDNAGQFRFEAVLPGRYRVAGHLVGFKLSHSTVEVAGDRDTPVSVAMEVGPFLDCIRPFPLPVKIQTGSGEPLPTAFLTVAGAGHRPLSEALAPSGSPGPCFAPATEDRVTLDVLGYGEHILKVAGEEPAKVAWQITIEPSPTSRLGRTARTSVTGQVRGRVFNEEGASIPDASVSFQPLDPRSGLPSFDVVADSRGRFDFIRVRPGTYRVTGKALGYETTVIVQEVVPGVETEVTVIVRRRESTVARGHLSTKPAGQSEACG